MRLSTIAPLAAFLALLGVFGAALVTRGEEPGPEGLVGQPMPAFALPGLTADAPGLSSADLQGDGPVLVNVFATWCAPCRVEHPHLHRLAEAGVPVYGVVWRDGGAAAQAYLDELGDPFGAVGLDADGRWGDRFGVDGAPETFVIGADGVVALHWRGAIDSAVISQILEPALSALEAQ